MSCCVKHANMKILGQYSTEGNSPTEDNDMWLCRNRQEWWLGTGSQALHIMFWLSSCVGGFACKSHEMLIFLISKWLCSLWSGHTSFMESHSHCCAQLPTCLKCPLPHSHSDLRLDPIDALLSSRYLGTSILTGATAKLAPKLWDWSN